MRISDWSSDVCSSDLRERILLPEALRGFRSPGQRCPDSHLRRDDGAGHRAVRPPLEARRPPPQGAAGRLLPGALHPAVTQVSKRSWPGDDRHPEPAEGQRHARSEEHTSELQSLMRISYAVFCLKKKKHTLRTCNTHI